MEVSKIIVAGACDVAAGTPLAILGEIGRAAHQGAIIKGGLYLEALAAVDTVLLDKTGTLTFGTPEIREVVWANGFGEQEIIAAAALLSVSPRPMSVSLWDREPMWLAKARRRPLAVTAGLEVVEKPSP